MRRTFRRKINKTFKQRKELTAEEIEQKRKVNLELLHPMSAALLSAQISEGTNNDFLVKSADFVLNKVHLLSTKWINSINLWTKEKLKTMALDEPEYEEGERILFENLTILSIKEPNYEHAYPMPAITCVNDKGWKVYFKTSKSSDLEEGDKISLKGTVKAVKEGITFLSRVSMKSSFKPIN